MSPAEDSPAVPAQPPAHHPHHGRNPSKGQRARGVSSVVFSTGEGSGGSEERGSGERRWSDVPGVSGRDGKGGEGGGVRDVPESNTRGVFVEVEEDY